jgi:septum formation protein
MAFPFISPAFPLVLASASPRRRRLLEQMGLPFENAPAGIEEKSEGEQPQILTCTLARRKAEAACSSFPGRWILGADTVVVLKNTILGKPSGPDDARRMLETLSGRDHTVVTGFTVLDPSGAAVHSESVATIVRFKHLTASEVEGYVNTGEPFGKAGGYAIQGIGAFMVEGVTGSYTNVVGLPLCAVIKALITVNGLDRFPFSATASAG